MHQPAPDPILQLLTEVSCSKTHCLWTKPIHLFLQHRFLSLRLLFLAGNQGFALKACKIYLPVKLVRILLLTSKGIMLTTSEIPSFLAYRLQIVLFFFLLNLTDCISKEPQKIKKKKVCLYLLQC